MHWNGTVYWIVSAVALFFLVMGLYQRFSHRETPFGFWANAQTGPVRDVTGYNHALGWLWFGFGLYLLVLELLLSLLSDVLGALLFLLGMVFGSLGLMLWYVLYIEPKYKR